MTPNPTLNLTLNFTLNQTLDQGSAQKKFWSEPTTLTRAVLRFLKIIWFNLARLTFLHCFSHFGYRNICIRTSFERDTFLYVIRHFWLKFASNNSSIFVSQKVTPELIPPGHIFAPFLYIRYINFHFRYINFHFWFTSGSHPINFRFTSDQLPVYIR